MHNDNVIDKFYGRRNLKEEESFCRTFSECNVALQFNHDNCPRTDGKIIYNDPEFLEIYQDDFVLKKTEDFLKISQKLSSSRWNALKMVTRALSIHECLHLLYTDFSLQISEDVKCRLSRNKTFVMHSISNIIEDAFIESYGVSVYPNITGYLQFIRMATALVPPLPEDEIINEKCRNICDFLNYSTDFLLFRQFKIVENSNHEIQLYIDKTKQLFLDGSIQMTWKKRYEFARKIFDLIIPLIPDENVCALDFTGIAEQLRQKVISNRKYLINNDLKDTKNAKITRRLFTDLEGNNIDDKEDISTQLLLDLLDFEEQEEHHSKYGDVSETETVITVIIVPLNYKLQNIFLHRNIKIIQKRTTSFLNYKTDYEAVYNYNKSIINSYKSRIFDLLQAKNTVISDRQVFGHGISSKHFGDLKKRYWYKKTQGVDTPSLTVLFLIDGSGSMDGEKIKNSQTACLIMHEVLQANGIEHCFVEHRAGGSKPEIEVNILFDFNSQPSQKYNIMSLNAGGDNRDSLALMWAERYLSTYTTNEDKVIVVLSDGIPAHAFDNYYPPASVEDTALTVSRIIHHGINIVAVALCGTYNDLKPIYPNLVSCDNLDNLPGLLMRIISKMLE